MYFETRVGQEFSLEGGVSCRVLGGSIEKGSSRDGQQVVGWGKVSRYSACQSPARSCASPRRPASMASAFTFLAAYASRPLLLPLASQTLLTARVACQAGRACSFSSNHTSHSTTAQQPDLLDDAAEPALWQCLPDWCKGYKKYNQ
eukprot:465137-Hanusia_phi.AAC.1